MPRTHQSVTELFGALRHSLCDLDAVEQVVALALYRELLQGAPVAPARVAEVVERATGGGDGGDPAAGSTTAALESLTYRDDDGRIIGFGGLAVTPMRHRFRVGGRTLYTWCAWDALFLADVLDVRADVESPCPETNATVRLTLSRNGVDWVEPAGAVISFLLPNAPLFEQTTGQTIGSFCHYIHFFASREAAAAWTGRHEGTFVLSLSEGFELGRMHNDARFDAVLDRGVGDREGTISA